MGFLFGGKKESNMWRGRRRGKTITIQVSEELYAELNEICRRYGIRKSQLIRDALIEKLARLEEHK